MELITFESEAFKKLQEQQAKQFKDAVKLAVKELQKENSADAEWISWEDAKKILPLKSKTSWQKLRDQGKIEFRQPSPRLILYSKKSLEQLILKNII